jgi:hypothetical protein
MYIAYYNWHPEAYKEAQKVLEEFPDAGYTQYYYDQDVYYIHVDYTKTAVFKKHQEEYQAMWDSIAKEKGWVKV